uniref:Uncharacterized protein n=1 Tax=Pipistrellus kuhlii TaxID=59472 RepID=A0A7J7XW87_PIPKU|nr:hypothetical protein mPipKuh1_010513 [Pipistrellus kuhlii]
MYKYKYNPPFSGTLFQFIEVLLHSLYRQFGSNKHTKILHRFQCFFCLFVCLFVLCVFKIYFIDFVQRGRERDRELETSMRESHRLAASCTPPTGDMPATKVHALDRNRTRDSPVPKPTLYPLSQTGLGSMFFLC